MENSKKFKEAAGYLERIIASEVGKVTSSCNDKLKGCKQLADCLLMVLWEEHKNIPVLEIIKDKTIFDLVWFSFCIRDKHRGLTFVDDKSAQTDWLTWATSIVDIKYKELQTPKATKKRDSDEG